MDYILTKELLGKNKVFDDGNKITKRLELIFDCPVTKEELESNKLSKSWFIEHVRVPYDLDFHRRIVHYDRSKDMGKFIMSHKPEKVKKSLYFGARSMYV